MKKIYYTPDFHQKTHFLFDRDAFFCYFIDDDDIDGLFFWPLFH